MKGRVMKNIYKGSVSVRFFRVLFILFFEFRTEFWDKTDKTDKPDKSDKTDINQE